MHSLMKDEKRGESQIAALYPLSSFVPPSSTLLCTVLLMHKSGVQKSTCLISLTMTQLGIVQVIPSGKAHGRGTSPEFKTGPQLLPQVGGSMVLVKPPIGSLLWVLYFTDKYLSSKTTGILHVLLKSLGANYDYFVGIRSFPLLRSSCKDTPHPTTHDLCIFSSWQLLHCALQWVKPIGGGCSQTVRWDSTIVSL